MGGERGHGAEGGRRFGFLLVFRVSLHGKQLCLCYDSNTASAVSAASVESRSSPSGKTTARASLMTSSSPSCLKKWLRFAMESSTSAPILTAGSRNLSLFEKKSSSIRRSCATCAGVAA